ncbi:MAG: hypothetical protein A3F14_00275 [Gammaproteobacteria bacterium RIFCSPHIGHO2_12_FULL_43_28]|nr:MAG: hypothetical protein A3F14_00275 [Gammaproteobacteria bacterium RIFCSPHIGHO2_12_FULL_43_28]
MSSGTILITENLTSSQIDELHELYKDMWWSRDRTKDEINTLLKTCFCFAAVDQQTKRLIGFTRILSDEMRYAYIYDLMVPENLRSRGIGQMLMEHVLHHPKLKNVKYVELTCAPNMAAYYEKFGFSKDYGSVVAMRSLNQCYDYCV